MKNNLIIGIIAIIIFIILINNFLFSEQESNFTKLSLNESTWSVETVSSLKSRIKGLSNRESLEKDFGMLFVFPNDGLHGIWMKEMNFPIDIIWLDKNFKVVDIKSGATPESYPEIFKPQLLSRYVLEINAREGGKAKIKIGDVAGFF